MSGTLTISFSAGSFQELVTNVENWLDAEAPKETVGEPAETPTPAKVSKKKTSKKTARKTAPNGAVPSVEELVPRMKAYAAEHGATPVREALTALGVAKMTELDEAGRLQLVTKLGL